MARYKELRQQRSWERQYVKWQYLKPLVDSLEVQMNCKEAGVSKAYITMIF